MDDGSDINTFLEKNEKMIKRYEREIREYRVGFIEKSSILETQLEFIILSYFSKNFQDYQLFNHIIFSDTHLGFSDKITMFEKLVLWSIFE